MENTLNPTEFLARIGAVKMPRFISIKLYENKEGDISSYVIGLNHSYENKVKKDISKLSDYLANLPRTEETALRYMAATELLNAFLKNRDKATQSNQSKAQQDAYTSLGRNVRQHNETGKIYLSGYCISKVSHYKAPRKEVKSRPLTIAKDKIRKGLKTSRFVTFGLDFDGFTASIEGETLILTGTAQIPTTAPLVADKKPRKAGKSNNPNFCTNPSERVRFARDYNEIFAESGQ